MGVASKKRRKIVVNKRNFVWQVVDKMPGYSLQVISEDKRFLAEYPMGFDPFCYLEVIGKEFPGLPNAGHLIQRVHCPQFGNPSAATPGMVRRLIEWSLFSERELIPVNCLGQPISPEGEELRKEQEQCYTDLMIKIQTKADV